MTDERALAVRGVGCGSSGVRTQAGALLVITLLVTACQKAASLEVDGPPHVRLGLIEPDRPSALRWHLVNRGDTSVRLRALTSSCACLRVLTPPVEIPPGERLAIEAELTLGRGVAFAGVVVVSTDEGGGAVLGLGVESWGHTDLSLEARPTAADFGTLPSGTPGTVFVTLRLVSAHPLGAAEISAVQPEDSRLAVAIQGEPTASVRVGDLHERTCILRVTVQGNASPEPLQSHVLVRATSRGHDASVTIPAFARFLGEYVLSPPSLYLGALAPGETRRATFTIRRRDEKPFVVRTITHGESVSLEMVEDRDVVRRLLSVEVALRVDGPGEYLECVRTVLAEPATGREEEFRLMVAGQVARRESPR